MTVILFEIVDCLFLELGLNIMKSITHHHDWDIFMYVRTKWLNSLLWEGVFPVASCFHVQFEVTGELGMLENVAFCVRSCHFALLNFKNQIIMGDYAHNFKPANFTLFINGRIKIRIPNRS